MDANLYFGMVVDMVRGMNIRTDECDELPDAFIVGIGYPVQGSLAEILHQVMHVRMHDFLPKRDVDAEQFIQATFPVPAPLVAGQAPPFLQCIQQELVPLIEVEYRADPADRTLVGHAWGGSFAWYTLFRQPYLFQRYVVASSIFENDDEQTYAHDHAGLPVRLHSVMQDGQGAAVLAQFTASAALLERRQYAGLRFTQQLLANCTHCAVVAPAFQAGLVAVFTDRQQP